MRLIVLFTLSLILFSCKESEIPIREMDPNSDLTSCLLIEKEFENKIGEASTYKELYLRCSVQDYFIKFCESQVTRKQLEKYINKGISVKMEIRQGLWDKCSDDEHEVQSRAGSYVAILSIE